jgi:hypothetical protein
MMIANPRIDVGQSGPEWDPRSVIIGYSSAEPVEYIEMP